MQTTLWADSAWRRGLRPDAQLAVSEWADRERILSPRSSAEPGRWSTDRTPYLREILDSLSPACPAERVVFMKSAQVGATEGGNCWAGYVIAEAPGPMLLVAPSVELAKRWSRQRLDDMIEATPALRNLVHPARERDSGNTILSKRFPAGILVLTGANSAAGLRSMPAKFLFLDEVDAYPADADGEGDPVALALARTRTFRNRKVFLVSTPTVAGLSRIEAAFEESDKRYYFVPCRDCGEPQRLTWTQVKWKEIGLPADQAQYCCQHCGSLWPESAKAWFLPRGEWRPTAEGDGRTRGYHVSSLYSPWHRWAEAAAEFEAAGRNPHRLKTFVNVTLGETFAEASEAPDWRRIMDRAEDYPRGIVPLGAAYLTAGVDVQKDRCEVELVGWGRNGESWSVDHLVFYGDPFGARLWQQLDELLARRFPHAAGGELPIGRLAIDSGYATSAVYAWTARHPGDRVFAVKGSDSASVPLGTPTLVDVNSRGKRLRRGARLWIVGSSILKQTLFGHLALELPDEEAEPGLFEAGERPAGLCHFPRYDAEFFRQLAAERLVKKQKRNGYSYLEWQKVRERNEALDCRIYNQAARLAAGLDRWTEAQWQAAEAALGVKAAAPAAKGAGDSGQPAAEPRVSVVPTPSPAATVVRSRWLGR